MGYVNKQFVQNLACCLVTGYDRKLRSTKHLYLLADQDRAVILEMPTA